MKPAIIALSGPIAGGKTTLSVELVKVLEWKYASFGNFIRKEAIKRGYDPNKREILQNIGVEFISGGWDSFCLSVLQEANWVKGEGLVVDGIRHLEGLNTIRSIVFPLDVYLVYVALEDDIRNSRLLGRQMDVEELHFLEAHSTEIQVKEILLNNATLIIRGKGDVDANVNTIINYLSK